MKRICLISIVCLVAACAWAYQPMEWLYVQWPYAYSMSGSAWYYLNEPCTQWCIGLSGGAWQHMSQGGMGSGWNYYQWPYCYSMGGASWYYLDMLSTQWCVNLTSSQWSRFGVVNVPEGMALIPSGAFSMGDCLNESDYDERPVHGLFISAFFMSRHEISKTLWDTVYAWATNSGYRFDHEGSGKASNHPVHSVNWYDAVKWCNARSEMEGLTPCYYTSNAMAPYTVYRHGRLDLPGHYVLWSGDGYRLPTEAEWEKAARGGAVCRRFAWGDTNGISHARANYYSSDMYSYDAGPTRGYHPAYTNGPEPYTSPGGSFPPNGYGLYDMNGNVWEWCWDWMLPLWYSDPSATTANTQGPDGGLSRVSRGGGWQNMARDVRNARRSFWSWQPPPESAGNAKGFRVVRRPP